MSQGVLYKATGESYIKEASYSAKTVKNNTNELKTAIITDNEVSSDNFDLIIKPTEPLPNDNSSNILYPDTSPFDRTIYLDTDTHVCEDLLPVFDLLDEFNLGVTFATSRHTIPNQSDVFSGYSGGILVFDSSEVVDEFHRLWYDTYWEFREDRGITRNQPSLSYAVLNSEADYITLPGEFNTFVNPGSDAGFLYKRAKILHGRPKKFTRIERKINNNCGMRVYRIMPSLTKDYKINMMNPSQESVIKKIYHSVLINGFGSTIKKSSKRIRDILYSLE
jgi:hypothetical protein